MDTKAFVIPIHDLDAGGRSVQFAIEPAWLRSALDGCETQPEGTKGLLDVFLSKSGTDVLVRGTIDVELQVPCARCLEPARLHPRIELSLLLEPAPEPEVTTRVRKAKGLAVYERVPAVEKPKPGKKAQAKKEEEDEFETEDADRDTYEGEEVVLDRFVREAVLLESPIFPLCSETCEGIRAPQASEPPEPEPERIDPRLRRLSELAKKQGTKE